MIAMRFMAGSAFAGAVNMFSAGVDITAASGSSVF